MRAFEGQYIQAPNDLRALSAAFCADCCSADTDTLLLETYVALIAQKISPHKPTETAARGGLAPRQLQRVAEFICTDLGRQIGFEDLALLVGLSPLHFARAFKKSVGIRRTST